MTLSTNEIPEKNREKARHMLLDYFGGELPEYFINSNDEWFYTHVLSKFMTKAEQGEITWERFDGIKKEAFETIEMYKELTQFVHSVKFRQLDKAFEGRIKPEKIN